MALKSLKRHEGYLLIDNRGAGQGYLEMGAYTCSHCQAIVVLNPLRQRERAYCPGCDHYICDTCEAVRQVQGCKTFKQVIEEVQEKAVRQEQAGSPGSIIIAGN